ncbi:hypothetical protein CANINC_003340 [Pichia inconspicua]|uniref:RING-Gid-type domain-containing protein n=1 Tax=Pichia inconspicua TaxID=52247 RepID=A0A4T0WZ54_9ASCO|nr:hypothetical protein CANINC_003340 [[Candida] inconspicua]
MSAKDKTKNGDKQLLLLDRAVTELADNKDAMNHILSAGESFVAALEHLVDETDTDSLESISGKIEDYYKDYISELEGSDQKLTKVIKNTSTVIESCNNGWSIEDIIESSIGEIPTLPFNDVKKLIGLDQLRDGNIYDDLLGNDEEIELLKQKFEELWQLEDYLEKENYTPIWNWLSDHEWAQRVERENDGTGCQFTLKGCLASKIHRQAMKVLLGNNNEVPNQGNSVLDSNINDDNSSDDHITKDVMLRKLRAAFWADTNFQAESPLLRVLIAGHLGLGQLVKMQQLVKRRRSSASAAVAGLSLGSQSGKLVELQNKTEVDSASLKFSNPSDLAQEIEVPDMVGGHPVHVCPVLRQMTGKQNVALALPCGHIISKQALEKLAGGSVGEMRSSRGGPLGHETVKCPYCPQRSQRLSAEPVVFVDL